MEQLLAVLAGAVAVAVSPLVPGVRPVAKAFVKGSLAMADVVAGSAVMVGQQWEHLMAHVGPEKKSGAETTMGETTTVAEGATVAASSAAAAGVEPDAEPQAAAAAQPAATVAAPTAVADSQAAEEQRPNRRRTRDNQRLRMRQHPQHRHQTKSCSRSMALVPRSPASWAPPASPPSTNWR